MPAQLDVLRALQESQPRDEQKVLLQFQARLAAAMHRVSSPLSVALLVMEAESVLAEELSPVGAREQQVLLRQAGQLRAAQLAVPREPSEQRGPRSAQPLPE